MTNIGPVTVTPSPSIHGVPGPDSSHGAPISPSQVEAWGKFFLTSFIAQVAIALGNISILGVEPLAFLTAWGHNLEVQASLAYEQSVTAVTAMAVAFDAESHGSINTGSPTTKTIPHTTATTANPAMAAFVEIGPLAPLAYAQGFTTVTYNGVAMKSEGGINSGHGTDGWLELFTLSGTPGPASGTHDVVITTHSPVHSIIGSVVTYTGCTGFSGFVSAATNAQGESLTVASGTNGMAVVGMASGGSIAHMPTGTQRSVQNVDTTTDAGNLIVGDAVGAALVTVSATR
jgi:hypothetical protein